MRTIFFVFFLLVNLSAFAQYEIGCTSAQCVGEILIQDIQSERYDRLPFLCDLSCKGDGESINICNLGKQPLAIKKGLKDFYKGAKVVEVKRKEYDLKLWEVVVYCPNSPKEKLISFKVTMCGERWVLHSL
ncbi:hypothetical protein [Runella sp. SP2]|uniref:hypothetical protein n=1 Tax=Runella sp. SP2 TaxID=2268026 RepID=UPI000F0822B0|nr:hypothetical protein [Runella sp. SP2]AYQ31964.1 hypothetical protein DTQ70_07165 [Runella sp. SP2]